MDRTSFSRRENQQNCMYWNDENPHQKIQELSVPGVIPGTGMLIWQGGAGK